MSKRLDAARGAADAVDARELSGLLTPTARQSAPVTGLRSWLASRSAPRFPLAQLAGRDSSTLPDRTRFLALVEEAAGDEWRLFGNRVNAQARNLWTTHPVTGIATPRDHWRSIQYMNGAGGGDVKLIWELNRHQPLVRLAQGYFVTNDEALAERAVALLDNWVQENPPGRGINWTSSLEIGFRAIAWCWIWSLTCSSPAWTDDRLSRFLVSLWHHARQIDRYDSTHHSPNTHLTGELLALYYVGLTFPELSRAKRWANRGRAVMLSELDRQVLDDGMHFERSVGYHRYTAEFYLHFMLLARAAGEPVSRDAAARIRALVAASWLMRRPDGTWPVIGDEDSGSTLLLGTGDTQSHTTILAVGAALFREPRWLAGIDDAGRSGAWWLLSADESRSLGTMPPSTAVTSGALPEAGYYVGREHPGTDAWYCLVDAGVHGGGLTGHAHTDLGHIEIARGDAHIVVDPGCASYTMNAAKRDWCRSEAAHACLVVQHAPLAVPRSAFSWQRVSPVPRVAHGESDALWWCDLAYQRVDVPHGLTHRRQVVLVRGWGIVIADWIDAASGVSFAMHWPLGVSSAVLEATRVRARGFSAHWTVGEAAAGTPVVEHVMSSPGYGREQPSTLLRVPARASGNSWVTTGFGDEHSRMTAARVSDGSLRIELSGASRHSLVMQPGVAPRMVSGGVSGRGQ